MRAITTDDKARLKNAVYILRCLGENDLADDVNNIANEVEVNDG